MQSGVGLGMYPAYYNNFIRIYRCYSFNKWFYWCFGPTDLVG